MQKRIISDPVSPPATPESSWLPLTLLAEVDLTSEAADHPIESALSTGIASGAGAGWRAATAGRQTIALRFYSPQHLRRIRVVFEETEYARTQEFVLRWSSDGGKSLHDIVRQQFTFAPGGATVEEEEYPVDLRSANLVELEIVPEISGGTICASLREWRLA